MPHAVVEVACAWVYYSTEESEGSKEWRGHAVSTEGDAVDDPFDVGR